MPDDLTKKLPNDANHVNQSQYWEMQDWCNKLHCTPVELKQAIAEVGTSIDAVKKYLHATK